MSIVTEAVTYQFTVPGGGEADAFGGATNVSARVHVFSDSGVTIELNHYRPGANVSLTLEQFNQLRAKIFEVTGKVV